MPSPHRNAKPLNRKLSGDHFDIKMGYLSLSKANF